MDNIIFIWLRQTLISKPEKANLRKHTSKMTRQEQFMLMIISILLVMKVRLTDGLLYSKLSL